MSWHNSTLPNAVTDQHCPKLGQERDPVSRARNNAIGVAEARHMSEHTYRTSAAGQQPRVHMSDERMERRDRAGIAPGRLVEKPRPLPREEGQ